MATKFKRGQRVRQILPKPIEGVVVDLAVVEDQLGFLVDTGEEGVPPRWFTEDQIEAVEE